MCNVEEVTLGDGYVYGHVYGPVELDMDTLLTYNGRGRCEMVQYRYGERRYGDQLATWAHGMGWRMERDDYYVKIERKKIKE